VVLERGRAPSGGAGEGEASGGTGEGETRRAEGTGEASGSRKPGTGEVSGSCVWKGFRVSIGLLTGLGCAGHQVDRLGQPSRRLVDRKNQVSN
jgi:hypothetical protein